MNRVARLAPAVLVLAAFLPAAAKEESEPARVAGAWVEEGGQTVVALHLPKSDDPGPPLTFYCGHAVPGELEPGGYGKILPESFVKAGVRPGEAVLVRIPAKAGVPSGVLLTTRLPAKPVPVHDLIHGELPPGGFFFSRPHARHDFTVARHLVAIGEKIEAVLAAPDRKLFKDETLEIARVARRMGVDSDDPDGKNGYVRVDLQGAGAGDLKTSPMALLRGPEGEKRIRAHFTNPRCGWANRHVKWMNDFWIVEYRRPTELRFTLDTSEVKAAGRIGNTWRGYGAVCVENIYPNGFGGSSANLDLPDVLVVPKGTVVREAR